MGRQGSPRLTDTEGRGSEPEVVGLDVDVVGLGFGRCVFVEVEVDELPPGWVEVVLEDGVVGAGVAEALVGAVAGVGEPLAVGVAPGATVEGPAATVEGRALGEVEGTAVRVLSRETPRVSRDSAVVTECEGTADWS